MKLINLLVFVTGAVVLSLEILGTRILGPYYGVSIFLWSALITITLASLSLGYFVGGRVADRRPRASVPGYLLAGAALWLLVIPALKYPAVAMFEPLGLRAAVLGAASLLFGPPLTLLGMISPYAIRLATTEVERVGSTAGRLYAISTIASVIAGLLTGFFLIPVVGVTQLLYLLSALLLVTAFLWNWVHARKRSGIPLGLLTLCAAAFAGLLAPSSSDTAFVLTRQSPYSEIRVLDVGDERYLLLDGTIHSLVDTVYWNSRLEYTAVMEIPRYCFRQSGAMLLIGLGAGSLAKRYSAFGWTVDAVEIDPVVATLAKTHFSLKERETSIAITDGRYYALTQEKKYDVILVDAFGSGSIPFHLITREAFELLAKRLKPGGIIALNLWALSWEDQIVRSVSATLETVFDVVRVFPIVEPPNQLGNIILMGRDSPITLVHELERPYFDPSYRYGPMYDRAHAWDNQFRADPRGAPVLTDDENPIDIWSEQVNYVARRDLLKTFEKMGILW